MHTIANKKASVSTIKLIVGLWPHKYNTDDTWWVAHLIGWPDLPAPRYSRFP